MEAMIAKTHVDHAASGIIALFAGVPRRIKKPAARKNSGAHNGMWA